MSDSGEGPEVEGGADNASENDSAMSNGAPAADLSAGDPDRSPAAAPAARDVEELFGCAIRPALAATVDLDNARCRGDSDDDDENPKGKDASQDKDDDMDALFGYD